MKEDDIKILKREKNIWSNPKDPNLHKVHPPFYIYIYDAFFNRIWLERVGVVGPD